MHSFTQEDLVQYLYRETSPEKTAAIRIALETNWQLRESYEQLRLSQEELNQSRMYAPRKKALDFILQYGGAAVSKQAETA